MKNPISIEVSVNLSLANILSEMKHQHGTKGIIEGIIEFCTDGIDFTFEDELIKALETFKKENQ